MTQAMAMQQQVGASRDVLDLAAYSPAQMAALLELAANVKAHRRSGEFRQALTGQTLAMIFAKPSTRTRVSFDVAMRELGGGAVTLNSAETQLGRGETPADTARVLSRFVDGIMARVFGHGELVELAEHASVPVINGLTDLHHPCQAVADLLTLREHFGGLRGLTLAYLGDGNNVLHSLLEAGALTGMHVRVATPPGHEPDAAVTARAQALARATGARLTICHDAQEAAAGADALYTDTWISMGQEAQAQEKLRAFAGFRVTEALMGVARSHAVFLHCLPAHRGEEVDATVIDGPQSVVFDQAENRLHAQKAILLTTLGGVLLQ